MRFGFEEGKNPTVQVGAVNRTAPRRTDRKNRTVENPEIYDRDNTGSYLNFKTAYNGWQLAQVVMMAEEDAPNQAFPHTIKLFDLGTRHNVNLHKDKLKTFSEEIGTWCWHVHITAKRFSSPYIV